MKVKIYIAAIAETAGGDLYNCIITSSSEEELIEKVNDFFEEEECEGHPVEDSHFSSVSEFDGLWTTDIYNDREYHVVACIREIETP